METQMTGIVFGSAPCGDWSFLSDYLKEPYQVFCADGGRHGAQAAGLRPDYLIGDWDSGGAPEKDIPSISLPPEKDMTDLQAALALALEKGCRKLILCGCMGGPRLDHTASNLMILEWLARRGGKGVIVDTDSEVRLLDSESFVLDGSAPRYHYFSLIPLDRMVSGIWLRGTKYPLQNALLTRGDTFSVSNEPTGDRTEITIGRGRVLLIRSQREEIE
ncbi:thiamine diphosphokinase [Pseudoflavonifractor sp. 524-17]|uniref:thiamine diphosphokinase n=1 Tax=Pseudoflavonifractor sp. 524-17 TaxID=2304577 RepID=UPI00325AA17B